MRDASLTKWDFNEYPRLKEDINDHSRRKHPLLLNEQPTWHPKTFATHNARQKNARQSRNCGRCSKERRHSPPLARHATAHKRSGQTLPRAMLCARKPKAASNCASLLHHGTITHFLGQLPVFSRADKVNEPKCICCIQFVGSRQPTFQDFRAMDDSYGKGNCCTQV